MSAVKPKLEILVPTKKPRFVVLTDVDPSPGRAPDEDAILGPIDPVEVAAHKGRYKISDVCAHCIHWYRGREQKLTVANGDPRCAAPGPCGGLPSLMGYPHYKGPLSREWIKTHCAVCGDDAPQGVQTPDGGEVGYCPKHLKTAMEMAKGRL